MKKESVKKRRPIKRRILPLALLGMAAALIVDGSGLFIANTIYKIKINGLPDSFSGFRIVQLSDLHGRELGKDSERLLEHITSQLPDIIVLTGDIADETTDMSVLERLIPKLVAIAPVFYVSGNHEWGAKKIDAMSAILEESGAVYLRNEFTTLVKSGEEIVLCGVEDPNSWSDMTTPDELVERVRAEYPESPVILLGHRNYWADKYPELDVSLIFCGHGHGGIIRLPFVGGLISTDHTLFPEYDAGVFEVGSYKMVVSRGLGDTIPMPRILNRPEVVTVILE